MAEVPLAGPEARHVVVQAGQSISRISKAYRVPKSALIAANHLDSPYKIKAGQSLVVPGWKEPAPVARPEPRQIVVEEGQSISRIAAKYRVRKSAIVDANHMTAPYKVKTGQHLVVPGADEAVASVAVGSRTSEAIPLDEPAPHRRTGSPSSIASSAQPQAEANAGPTPVSATRAALLATIAVAPAPTVSATPAALPAAIAVAPAPTVSATPAALPAAIAVAQAQPSVAAAPPAGVTCPPGTTGAWSTDIIKQAMYICR
jgi:LysM repeat protein